MIMVSFCWKMNVLPHKIKNNSVSSTMFLKLIIKVVAFFLGHPVYVQSLKMFMTVQLCFEMSNLRAIFLRPIKILFLLLNNYQGSWSNICSDDNFSGDNTSDEKVLSEGYDWVLVQGKRCNKSSHWLGLESTQSQFFTWLDLTRYFT